MLNSSATTSCGLRCTSFMQMKQQIPSIVQQETEDNEELFLYLCLLTATTANHKYCLRPTSFLVIYVFDNIFFLIRKKCKTSKDHNWWSFLRKYQWIICPKKIQKRTCEMNKGIKQWHVPVDVFFNKILNEMFFPIYLWLSYCTFMHSF